MAKAYCSIGEIYLTDLCYEDNAEEKCEEAIGRAVAVDGDSMDGQQGLVTGFILGIAHCYRPSALLTASSFICSDLLPSFGKSAY